MNNRQERSKKMHTGIIIITVIAVLAAILIGRYLYGNFHYDDKLMRNTKKAGFTEKQAKLPGGIAGVPADGTVINYGEGPDNGPALLLIHGQTVAWQDYDTVLPAISESFHVYAVDCFGHGGSSHDRALYSCSANCEALMWFIKNIIKESCFLSGHSSGGVMAAWISAEAPELVKGVLLEDPPLFSVTPEEVQEGKGAAAWYETYKLTNDFCSQNADTDFTLYYLCHSYLFGLFGGLQNKLYDSAVKYRQKHPNEPVKISWFPAKWLRTLLYMDNYDPAFGDSFYDGSWMKGVDQAEMLEKIECNAVYLKANTRYGKDSVLYAANSDEDAEKVTNLIKNCGRINIDSGHDIHLEHPDVFIDACLKLKSGI